MLLLPQGADLLFITLCVPATAADYALTSDWPFGEFWSLHYTTLHFATLHYTTNRVS